MRIKKYFALIVMGLISMMAWGQNTLSAPDLIGGAGKSIMVPVSMENTDEIVAVQFNLQLPFSKTSNQNPVLNSSRNTNGHTVSVRSLGGNKYTVVIVNMSNRPLAGSGGMLVNFPMTIPSGLEPEAQYPITLTDVVLTNRRGDNIQSGSRNGSFTVQRGASPDLAVSDVNISTTKIVPGEPCSMTWKVSNVGDAATKSGWSEKIYLVSTDTEESMYVGSTYFNNTIVAGGYTTRTESITIPKSLGLEGEVTAKVVVEPSSGLGEYVADRGNNTAIGGTATVSKSLFLTAPATSLKEGESMRLTLMRSGDRSMDETYTVVTTLPTHVTIPASVTIPAGQSSVTFNVVVPDNAIVNDYSQADVTVKKAHGYPEDKTISFSIQDDELLPLMISLDKSEYNEGETMKLTVNVPYRISDDDLTLSFSIEKSKRFRLPQSYTFAKGATKAVIEIPIMQDNVPANVESIQLNVSAEHHLPASTIFILNDDDVPAIEMSLQPETISEAAGGNAIFATVTRVEATNSKITLKLSDDSNSELYYNNTITMPEGTTSVTFPIGVKDNQKVDGTRKVNLTAAVYITDCGCSAIGNKQTSVTKQITITDNDGPTLYVTSDKTTILEGDTKGAMLTIRRNDSTAKPLTVTLSTKATDVVFASTVTIPAGQESVTTPFIASKNAVAEGNRTISVTAVSDGYNAGSAWLLISDQTLPDAQVEEITASKTIESGSNLPVGLKIRNIGAAAMPAGVDVKFTMGDVSFVVDTKEPIAEGDTYTLSTTIPTPVTPGTYTLTAQVNTSGKPTELQLMNNSKSTNVTITSAYVYAITADKENYVIGETVHLTGVVKNNAGTASANVPVEPYIVYSGARTPFAVTSDEAGNFSVDYVIPEGFGGEFSYGVCTPGEKLTDSKGNFYSYGLSRVSFDFITNKVFVNEPFASTIKIKNMSKLPLHNIKATCDDAGAYVVTFTDIATLEGNGTAELAYAILPTAVSAKKDWDILTFHITTDEGAVLDVKTYNYTQSHTPTLVVNTTSINTTVTKGKTRTYPITITNTGLAETGKISVLLPTSMSKFISLATPSTMPSLATGDSATVMLKFSGVGYDVNLIQKGSIAINCENGNGKAVYFNVKVVSEEKGNLTVRVQDEKTIYGDIDGNKPYLSGATVKISDYNTGALVASDITGQDGSITFQDINEGYYKLYVTADKHDSYTQNVLVNPGETTVHTATISYQAVSVSWDVVETEIDDEYEITTSLTYETQVPVPVVLMTAPDTLLLENIELGKSALFNVVLRNKGLIAAQEVNVSLPTHPDFTFVPLVDFAGFSLAPEQSYVIPVLVMHNEDFLAGSFTQGAKPKFIDTHPQGEGANCNGKFGAEYKWPCGEDTKFSWLEKPIQWASNISCGDTKGHDWGSGSMPFGNYGPGGPYTGGNGSGIGPGGDVIFAALVKLACTICECLCNDPMPPCGGGGVGMLFGDDLGTAAGSCAKDLAMKGAEKATSENKVKAAGCAKALNDNYGAKETAGFDDDDDNAAAGAKKNAPRKASKVPALVESSLNKSILFYTYMATYKDYRVELSGAPELLNDSTTFRMYDDALDDINYVLCNMRDEGTLWDFDLNSIPDETSVDDKSQGVGPYLTSLMPAKMANNRDFQLRSYVERVRNKMRRDAGMGYDSDNHMNEAVLERIQELRDSCTAAMVDMGCANMWEVIQGSHRDWVEYQETLSSNTCATVKLEIKQKLVLTRQAFRGTLTINNDSDSELTDISAKVEATRMSDGYIATAHEMQIVVESIEGFGGDKDGSWTLGAGKSGVATFLFIPTKYAAPDTLTTYSFGGNLYFSDSPGSVQTRMLYPVSLQVKPTPELDLTYFMQRDVYGDNPLTEDVVEPVIPAEFSVLIHNKGNGEAKNVRMLTQKPQIVENEKGLLVDFDIVNSSLNGGDAVVALDDDIATQFGDIAAGGSAYATWGLTASLMGHFIDYDVSYSHLTSYDNPDLSLLDNVTIHELIHSVSAMIGDQKYRAWITNDFPDGHDDPDHIYFSNGTDEDIAMLKDITEIEPLGDSKYRITVTVPQKQWFYTNVTNPGGKYSKILSLKNEDTGKDLDPENFWTTDYTMRDGADPLLDYRLHIADLTSGPETRHYIVEFEPMPEVLLAVESIETVPDEEDIAEQPINELTVTFNKDIDPETFTRRDIVLRYEGVQQYAEIPITKVSAESNRVFKLNTSKLVDNGFYVLQVKADSIRDAEGFWGFEGKQVRWMLFKDGLVHYNIEIAPLPTYGEINSSTGFLAGSHQAGYYLELEANPKTGYVFTYWAKRDNTPASDNFGVDANEPNFCDCAVTVTPQHAKPRKAEASGKTVTEDDLEILSTEPTIRLELNNTTDIVAVFKPIPYSVKVICREEEGELDVVSGIYDYGTVLTLDAREKENHRLIGYRINGVLVETTEPYNVTVSGVTEIEAVFKDLTPVNVLLSEGSDAVIEDLENARVNFYRTFRKGTWNTICLPCAVDDIEKAFGAGTRVVRLSGIEGTMVQFADADHMEANVPYLIQPGVLNSPLYADGEQKTMLYDLGVTATEAYDGDPTDVHGLISFVGTYDIRPIEKGMGNYYISSDVFYYLDEGTKGTMNTGRYRGYFHVDGASAAKMLMNIGGTTAVNVPLEMYPNSEGVYNLNGVMVRQPGESLKGLAPGLYLSHGKKIYVR